MIESVIAQAGVIGTWCRMTDIFSIFTEVDEQKIGMAVEFEPIPGKMAFFLAVTAQIKCISVGESARIVKSSILLVAIGKYY